MKTYYLWKGEDNGRQAKYYISDYHETNKDGLVKIDGHGYLKVILVHTSKNKLDLMKYAI